MSPEGTDFILTTDIPDSKANVLVLHGFDIESFTQNVSIASRHLIVRGGIDIPIVGIVVTMKIN